MAVCLEWKNLNLSVQKSEYDFWKCKRRIEDKKILSNVNGRMESGELIAIIGSSGAGKTSLLASVSQRYRGQISGQMLLNGQPVNRKTMTNISCFVPQFDITIDSLTPNEHLYFMSELKLGNSLTRERKNANIQILLCKMGLQGVANNRIDTLSGGERKKLNLTTDLLTNPPIIFCDEPTTGLDSYNALTVIKSLRQLAQPNVAQSFATINSSEHNSLMKSNELEMVAANNLENSPKAIMCSIHQPNSELFQCFSHLVLMYSGRCVFQGTVNDALAHFSSFGFRCPISFNPADYFVNVLSGNAKNDADSGERTFFDRPIELIRKSYECQPNKRACNESFAIKNNYSHHNVIWIHQILILLHRSYIKSTRNAKEFLTSLLIYIIPNVAMALVYSKTNGRTQESIQDIQGVLFLIIAETIFSACYGIIHFYPAQMPILRRETNEHVYNFSAYYLVEILCSIPSAIIKSFVPLFITYYFAGFYKGFWLYFELAITLVITTFTANAYGLMLSGLFDSSKLTAEIAPPFDLVFLILAGVYINLHEFPYLRFISFFFFATEAMSTLFWHDVTTIDCSPALNGNCFQNGTQVLQDLSYQTTISGVYWDYFGLFCLAVIMHSIAFLGIRRIIRSVGYY